MLGRRAIPGYVLLAFWLIGVWSDVEFARDKIRALSAHVSPWLFFAVGVGWLTWLLSRPPQAEARLAAMRRLLKEAAATWRAVRRPERETIDSAGSFSWRDLRLQRFLVMGFAAHVKRDYDTLRNDEREKWNDAGQTFLVELVPRISWNGSPRV